MNDSWSAWQQPAQEKPNWLTPEIELALIAGNYPLNQDGMLLMWKDMGEHLKRAKELEMEYRKICVAFLTPTKPEGTTNVELGAGYTAKVVNKYNYNLASDNDKIWSALDKIAKVGNQGAFIAERLVSWHPSFLKTEYTTLQEEAEKGSQDAKAILEIVNSEMLTITDAAPTLEIKEPKAKKK
jgi:hypothetical protein